MQIVEGVSKEEPVVVNEKGGAQSKSIYRADLVDPIAFFAMTQVLAEGAEKYEKYGKENWRNIPVHEHLNHLLIHVYAYLAGDTSDLHISHAMCRAMFAQAVLLQSPDYVQNRKQTILEV